MSSPVGGPSSGGSLSYKPTGVEQPQTAKPEAGIPRDSTASEKFSPSLTGKDLFGAKFGPAEALYKHKLDDYKNFGQSLTAAVKTWPKEWQQSFGGTLRAKMQLADALNDVKQGSAGLAPKQSVEQKLAPFFLSDTLRAYSLPSHVQAKDSEAGKNQAQNEKAQKALGENLAFFLSQLARTGSLYALENFAHTKLPNALQQEELLAEAKQHKHERQNQILNDQLHRGIGHRGSGQAVSGDMHHGQGGQQGSRDQSDDQDEKEEEKIEASALEGTIGYFMKALDTLHRQPKDENKSIEQGPPLFSTSAKLDITMFGERGNYDVYFLLVMVLYVFISLLSGFLDIVSQQVQQKMNDMSIIQKALMALGNYTATIPSSDTSSNYSMDNDVFPQPTPNFLPQGYETAQIPATDVNGTNYGILYKYDIGVNPNTKAEVIVYVLWGNQAFNNLSSTDKETVYAYLAQQHNTDEKHLKNGMSAFDIFVRFSMLDDKKNYQVNMTGAELSGVLLPIKNLLDARQEQLSSVQTVASDGSKKINSVIQTIKSIIQRQDDFFSNTTQNMT